MKRYTVVGFYPDNDQVFVEHTKAKNPKAALINATKNLCTKPVIVDVFNGHLKGLLNFDRVSASIGFGKLVFLA